MKRFLTALSALAAFSLGAINPQFSLNVWDGTQETADVELYAYLPDTPAAGGAPAAIVCPGGSYFWLDLDTEGEKVAQWLNANGVAAFVLRYRTGGVWDFITHSRLLRRGNRFPDCLRDAQRAMQTVRERAGEWSVDPGKVGIVGFSAGGHLATMAAELFGTNFLEPLGIEPAVSLRPDFAAAVYPVVSMTADCTHRRSRRGLLADRHDKAMRDSLSTELHARKDMPPLFLVNCEDDPVVDPRNSALLDSALTAAGAPHRYIRYRKGGHGFGADPKKAPEAARWMPEFIEWLKSISIIQQPTDQ